MAFRGYLKLRWGGWADVKAPHAVEQRTETQYRWRSFPTMRNIHNGSARFVDRNAPAKETKLLSCGAIEGGIVMSRTGDLTTVG